MINLARTWHARTWPVALMLSASAMLTTNLAMAQGSVNLTFAWPDDVKASVSFEAERAHSSGSQEVKRGLKGSYNMSTSSAIEPSGSGLSSCPGIYKLGSRAGLIRFTLLFFDDDVPRVLIVLEL